MNRRVASHLQRTDGNQFLLRVAWLIGSIAGSYKRTLHIIITLFTMCMFSMNYDQGGFGMMRKAWISAFVFIFLLVGCSRDEVPVPDDVSEEAQLQLEQMQSQVRSVADRSDIYTGLIYGLNEITDWDPLEIKMAGFEWLVSYAKEADVLAVQSFVKEVLEIDEQLAGQAVLQLDGHMMEREPSSWLGFLQDYEMPARFRAHGFDLWFRYYGDESSALDLAGALLMLQDPTLEGYIEGVFTTHLQRAVRNLDEDSFAQLISLLRARIPQDSALLEIVLQVEGESLVQYNRWNEAFAHYKEHADIIGDSYLSRAVGRILQHSSEEDDTALQEQIRAWGYDQGQFPRMQTRLARWDLQQLNVEHSVKEIVDVVHKIMDSGVPSSVVASGFLHGVFREVLVQANADEKETLHTLLIDIRNQKSDWSQQLEASLLTSLLDVLFLMEDYAGALDLLEDGIPGFGEDWHAKHINKIKGHVAEQEGRYADAVKYYENHISRVEAWTEPFVSPEDGRKIFADEVIALNAGRIGDLWSEAGEAEKARASYQRAMMHYEAALDAASEDPRSVAELEKRMRELESVMR